MVYTVYNVAQQSFQYKRNRLENYIHRCLNRLRNHYIGKLDLPIQSHPGDCRTHILQQHRTRHGHYTQQPVQDIQFHMLGHETSGYIRTMLMERNSQLSNSHAQNKRHQSHSCLGMVDYNPLPYIQIHTSRMAHHLLYSYMCHVQHKPAHLLSYRLTNNHRWVNQNNFYHNRIPHCLNMYRDHCIYYTFHHLILCCDKFQHL